MEMIWKTKRYLPYAAMAFAVSALCCDAVVGIYLASLALLSYEAAR